jgi:hypothetical protein
MSATPRWLHDREFLMNPMLPVGSSDEIPISPFDDPRGRASVSPPRDHERAALRAISERVHGTEVPRWSDVLQAARTQAAR